MGIEITDTSKTFRTRSGKKVTIHEIRFPPGHEPGNCCFPVKGTIWERTARGERPRFCIWQLSGEARPIGAHPDDIVAVDTKMSTPAS